MGVNIGANKTSSGKQRIDDFLICLEKVHKFADYITINISSPNTPNLRELHNEENLKILISALEEKSIEIKLNIDIKNVNVESGKIVSISDNNNNLYKCDKLIFNGDPPTFYKEILKICITSHLKLAY